MKTIVLTGGAGFIGSHTASRLLKNGWETVIIDNFNDYYPTAFKRENILELEAEAEAEAGSLCVREGDITDAAFLEDVFSRFNPSAVIHLAAAAGVRPSIENPGLYVRSNINGTVNVLEQIKKHGVKRLVFASSSSVYGNNKKVPFSEKDPVDTPISPYAATKKAGELLCHTYHKLYGINTACLRFFTVYGPRQRPDLAIYKFTERILKGQPLPVYGDGGTMRDYTYIDDIMKGVFGALEWTADYGEPRYDIFNLGESRTVTLHDMIGVLENALNKKAVINRLRPQPGDVEKTYADISRAREVIGYNPETDFETGIKKFVDWYLEKRG